MTNLLFPDMLHVMETEKIWPEMRPRFEASEKFIFKSEGDLERETVKQIHLTSEEMIDAGLFHLPFPSVWIEDPWDQSVIALLRSVGAPEGRHFWYCEEEGDRILVYSVEGQPQPQAGLYRQLNPTGMLPLNLRHRQYAFHSEPHVIDLSPGRKPVPWAESFDSPLHSVRQFIVTLATAQADVEIIPGKPWKNKQPVKTREYDHRILRILLPGETRHSIGDHEATGAKRKLHFVSGYIWGKNAKPKEEQRWIAPYWRGDAAHGVSLTRHREILRK